MSLEQQGKFGFSAESVGELWGKTEAKVELPAPNLVFGEYEHFKPAQNFTFAFRTA
jgi:hypothetical protein